MGWSGLSTASQTTACRDTSNTGEFVLKCVCVYCWVMRMKDSTGTESEKAEVIVCVCVGKS